MISSEAAWNSTVRRRPLWNASGSHPIDARSTARLPRPGERRPVHTGPGSDGSGGRQTTVQLYREPSLRFPPDRICSRGTRTHCEGRESSVGTGRAALDSAVDVAGILPSTPHSDARGGARGALRLAGRRSVMAGPTRRRASQNRAPAPPFRQTRPRRRGPDSWRTTPSRCDGPDDTLELLGVDAGMAEGHRPAVRGDRQQRTRSRCFRLRQRAPLRRADKSRTPRVGG